MNYTVSKHGSTWANPPCFAGLIHNAAYSKLFHVVCQLGN